MGSRARPDQMETKKPKKVRKVKKKPKSLIKPNMTAEQKAEFRIKEKLSEQLEIEEIVKILSEKCGMEEGEVRERYEEFLVQHPEGEISKEEYIGSMKNSLMAESLFRVFDEDNSGNLNFFEYLQADSVTDLDSDEDKLNWIFMAFDQDGGGFIDVKEITDIVTCLFRFAKMEEDADMLIACVEDLTALIDKDGDGDISKEGFVKYAANSKFIS